MEFADYIIKITESLGVWGYLIAFLLAFLESLAFIGGFIPGTTIIVLLGFMCFRGYLNIYFLMFSTVLGAVLGDGVSYWLGTKGSCFFKNENRFLKARHLDLGQKFFEKHGNKSIFLGRFVGLIRPMIPFAAGLSGMNYKIFLFWNIFSGIAWAVSHIYLGYFFGGAFKMIEAWSTRVSIMLLILAIAIVLFWLLSRVLIRLARYMVEAAGRALDAMLKTYPVRFFISRYPETASFVGRRFKKSVFTGLPMSILLTLTLFAILFVMLANAILDSDPITDFDERVSLFMLFFRDPFLIKAFLWISLLSKLQIIIAFSIAFIATMALWRKSVLIWPYLAMLGICEGAIWIIRDAFIKPRPVGIIPAYLENTNSFPSEHSALSVFFFGSICYFIVRTFLRKSPLLAIWMIFTSTLLMAMIGFSRLYLGVHYFSDVIGGYLIGGTCLLAGITLFEWLMQFRDWNVIEPSEKVRMKKLMTVPLCAMSLCFLILYGNFVYKPLMLAGKEPETIMTMTTSIHPQEIFASGNWPKFTTGLSGSLREPVSLMIWAKNDQRLTNAFLEAGWKVPDQPSINNIFKMAVAAIEGRYYDSASLTPVFWLNELPDLAFEKNTEDVRPQLHFIRLWQTNLINADGNVLYVGATGKTSGKVKLDVVAERNILIDDLTNAEALSYVSVETLSEPEKSSKWDFSTHYSFDGKSAIIVLKPPY